MALREIIARFGIQVDPKGLKKAEKGIGSVVGKLQAFGVVMGAGMVARGIKNFITGMVDAGDALGKTSTQLGLSSDQLQAWQAAADYAGVSGEKFSQSMRVMQKNALLAEQGSKQAGDAFKKLGVDFKGTNGQLKTGDALMREVGLALNKTENSTERVALAQQLMGRTGAALLPLFSDGKKGLDEALKSLERFGGGMSEGMVKAAEDAQNQFTSLNIATMSLKSQFAVVLLPAISQMALGLAKLFAWTAKAADGTGAMSAAILSLGLALGKLAILKYGAQFMQLARAAALPLAKFLLLFLVVDDLIALFSGRGSVIGAFIDKIFGKGSAEKTVNAIKGIGQAVADGVASGNLTKLDNDLDKIFGPLGHDIVADVAFTFSMIGEVIDHAVDGIGASIDQTAAEWSAWWSRMTTEFAEGSALMWKDAKAFGGRLIDGIVSGIKSGAKAVGEAVIGVGKAAMSAAKNFFKIGSPSLLFAQEIGEPIPQGIAMGATDAARAASRITTGALAVASGMGGGTLSAPARGGAGAGAGGVIFKSDIAINVSGGSPDDPQIAKLRQGVRSELRDNRRATLDALQQLVGAPA